MTPAEQLPLVGGLGIGIVGEVGGGVDDSVAYQLAASTGAGGGGAGGGSVGDGAGGAGGGGDKLKEMPDKYVMAIVQFLDWHVNGTADMERLRGRSSSRASSLCTGCSSSSTRPWPCWALSSMWPLWCTSCTIGCTRT